MGDFRPGDPDEPRDPGRTDSGDRAGREPGAEDERELRILLERAVPRLPAPEGRLHGVRERVTRNRRRRRTAGAAAAAVTGLALAGTLLPAVLRAGPESTPPASSAPSVTAPPHTGPSATSTPTPTTAPSDLASLGTASPDPTPSDTRDARDRRTRFAQVAGLSLRLPDTWQALDVPEDARYKQPARGFVSTQRLDPYDRPCPGNDRSLCLPVEALRPGGALVTLVAVSGADLSAKAEEPPALHASDSLSPACRKIAGTQEFTGLIGGVPAPYSAVTVTVCVAGDSPGTVEDVHAMITGADFGRAVETAPTTAEHPPNAR